jgi:DNA-binding transcriptional regulator GbsR (MarR family)
MGEYDKEFGQIRDILRENPRGMTITEISEEINVNRNSVAKYLEVLSTSGHVEKKSIGVAKVYFLSNRVPISAMMNFSSDHVFVLNAGRKIMQANDNLVGLLGSDMDDLVDRKVEDSPASVLQSSNPWLEAKLNEALQGHEFSRGMSSQGR